MASIGGKDGRWEQRDEKERGGEMNTVIKVAISCGEGLHDETNADELEDPPELHHPPVPHPAR